MLAGCFACFASVSRRCFQLRTLILYACSRTYIHVVSCLLELCEICMYAYMYVRMHVCMCPRTGCMAVNMDAFPYIFTPTHRCACMHALPHAQANMNVLRHQDRHADMNTYTHTCVHTYIHTYIHTYMHTYIHTYIHTYTIIRIIYIHAQVRRYVRPSPAGPHMQRH